METVLVGDPLYCVFFLNVHKKINAPSKPFQLINLRKDVLCIFKEKDFQAGQDGSDEGDWHKSREYRSIMDTNCNHK